MNIQVLTNKNNFKGDYVTINNLHDPQSLDEFDINVIDLKYDDIWLYNGSTYAGTNMKNNLVSISKMINNCKKTKIIILFPQNVIYQYNLLSKSNVKKIELKDMIINMKGSIINILYDSIKTLDVLYEKTTTRISNEDIPADFWFNVTDGNILTKSNKSEKATTIKLSEIIVTTLNIESYEHLMSFLNELHLLKNKEIAPEWFNDIKMFDDNNQLEIITENQSIICNAENNIKNANSILDRNKRYKSILYTNGDELVEVVFEILESVLGCDLSNFVDKKNEDFIFKLDGKIFIGEIKGVSHNIKYDNVAQLDRHVQSYRDNHNGVDDNNIVALLIINHQRQKSLTSREEVNNKTIELANRYKSLMIETHTLLKLFEKYLNNEIDRKYCINLLSSKTGLLKIDD